MAAGLGYKEFATGDVLTAADANGYLASQVVMVFANAAARTSAITSPQEGMLSYLKDTDSTQYYSGSAWVNVAGTASSPALILTGSADFTTSSAVNINNCFSATYNNYHVEIDLTAISATDAEFHARMRASGTDNTAASYRSQWLQQRETTVGGAGYNAQTSFRLGALASTKVKLLAWSGTLKDPFNATNTKQIWHAFMSNSSDYYQNLIVGNHDVDTSYDGITFYPASGTISGKIRVYGYTLS